MSVLTLCALTLLHIGLSNSVTTILTCSDTARRFREFYIRDTFKATCVQDCSKAEVRVSGSQVYTDDSSICKSAIHAGVTNENGGSVEIRRLPGRRRYAPTEHNGIMSSSSREWSRGFSFTFASVDCVGTLGLRNNSIPDSSFKSSGTDRTWSGARWHAHYARLDRSSLVNAWRPDIDNEKQWWEIDMGDIYDVRGIVTQGSSRYGTPQYITSYKIKYKMIQTRSWQYVLNVTGQQKIFSGNRDNDGRVTNYFVPSLTARYVRLEPVTWVNHISLRAEFLVCVL